MKGPILLASRSQSKPQSTVLSATDGGTQSCVLSTHDHENENISIAANSSNGQRYHGGNHEMCARYPK
jgi:hypothetical protein